MAVSDVQTALTRTGTAPLSVQPGGGFCMRLELAWGRLRRGFLRRFRPGYIRRMAQKRQGRCDNCPHDIIDPRDLKFCRNVCGYHFRDKDDRFRWRGQLGLARAGLAEVVVFTLLYLALASGIAALALLVHGAFWLLLLVPTLLWLEVVYFFRDPKRHIPTDPAALVSPADGTVTHVDEVVDLDFPGGRAFRVGIFLSIFNVHINRVPRPGRVRDLRYIPGAFLDARNPQSAVQNEQLWTDLEDEAFHQLVRVKQISGAIARRIVCWLRPGEEVKAGQRFGMIKFGSRTEVLLPMGLAMDVRVKVGDKVKGGSTVLLRLT
jgi:phosphatidylserine decarboxylase